MSFYLLIRVKKSFFEEIEANAANMKDCEPQEGNGSFLFAAMRSFS
jgi:hypothetical protein